MSSASAVAVIEAATEHTEAAAGQAEVSAGALDAASDATFFLDELKQRVAAAEAEPSGDIVAVFSGIEVPSTLVLTKDPTLLEDTADLLDRAARVAKAPSKPLVKTRPVAET